MENVSTLKKQHCVGMIFAIASVSVGGKNIMCSTTIESHPKPKVTMLD